MSRAVLEIIRRQMILTIAVIGALTFHGCAAVGLTPLGVSTGVATSTGVSYTLDSILTKLSSHPCTSWRAPH